MPPLAIAGGVAAAGIASGAMSAKAQSDASKRSRNLANLAADEIQAIDLPNYEMMKLELEQLRLMGQITPEEEAMYLQQASGLQNVDIDPRLAKTEMDAIEQLSRISQAGGLDEQAQLAIAQATQGAQAQARGAREANLRQAQARGVAGSGLEFALNQMANQDASNQAYMAGLQNAAGANQRDLQALQQMAQLGGTVTERQLGADTRKAQAQDAINQFNAANMQGREQRRSDRSQDAQKFNVGMAQNVEQQNVGLRNAQQEYNKQLQRQRYLDELEKARAAGAARTSAAQIAQAGGSATGQALGGIGQSLIGAGGAIFSGMYGKDQKAGG